MKTLAIIQARMGSERLPGKMLMDINGKPMIQWVVNRVKAVNVLREGLIEEIVVATTTDEADTPIVEWCEKAKVACFRGSADDVLDRYYQCAKFFEAEWILRICGDCPLLSPEVIFGLLTKFPRMDYDALPFNRGKIPDGWDAELFNFNLLEQTWEKGGEREHMTQQMRGNIHDFLDVRLEEFNFKKVKLSVDTLKDLERVRKYAKLLT